MSTVIDQQDETEVPTLSRSQVDIYFLNRIDTAGAEPSKLRHRQSRLLLWKRSKVSKRDEKTICGLCCSHPVQTKNATLRNSRCHFQCHRCTKTAKISTNGQHVSKVYRAILFMLRYPPQPSDLVGLTRKVVTFAAPAAYLDCFFAISLESSRNAGIYFAQQKTEPAEKPSLGPARAIQQRKMPYGLDYNPRMPWDAVFAKMAHQVDQWARPMLYKISLLHRGSGLYQIESCRIITFPRSTEDRQSKENSKREKLANVLSCAGIDPHTGQLQVNTGTSGSGDGTVICFSFPKGQADACAIRAHACQWCFEPQRHEQRQTDAAIVARTKGVGKGGGKP